MRRQVCTQIVLFSCLVMIMTSSAVPIARENCTTHCGTIAVPFPFGIGTGCYLGKWFEIICGNNTIPRLNRTKHEVVEIFVNGTITVRNPITFSNCGAKDDNAPIPSLEGSPFRFSQSRNRFASVACGSIAVMNSTHGSTVAACLSICNEDDTSSDAASLGNSCNDNTGCCQTTIPQNLQSFIAGFLDVNNDRRRRGENPCRYAFLVDQEWFSSNSLKNVSKLLEMTGVPVVLDWGLYGISAKKVFGVPFETNSSTTDGYRNNYELYDYYTDNVTSEQVIYANASCYLFSADSSSLNNQSRLECSCPAGFEGNPYLLRGCLEINECENISGRCGEDSHCTNKPIGSFTCSPSKNTFTDLLPILAILIACVVVILLLIICLFCLRKTVKRRFGQNRRFFKRNGGLLLQRELYSSGTNRVEKTKLFSMKELEKATNKFSAKRVLGQGGQGTVYKGMLADGKIVAVKRSKVIVDRGELSQFINEVVILSQINHRNVVKLLGCCLETEVPLLVYEFVPNGTLSKYIHDENEEFPISWEMRVRIAMEVSGALSYLHSSASIPIFHRDIKSTNILLDDKFRAKVADFGISRLISIDQTHLTTQVHGTFGYLDPEYFQSSQFTDKSDVYSFGVVLVELLSGQKPISVSTNSEEEPAARGLAMHFTQCMEENRLYDVVDLRVMKEGEREAIAAFSDLAGRCLDSNGRRRPTMREVATSLEDIYASMKSSIAQMKNPWVSFGKSTNYYSSESSSSSNSSETLSSLNGI